MINTNLKLDTMKTRKSIKLIKGGKGFDSVLNQIRNEVRWFDENQQTDETIHDCCVKILDIYGIADWYWDMFKNDTDFMNDLVKTVKNKL